MKWPLILAFFTAYFCHAQSDYEVLVSSRGSHAVKRYDLDGNYIDDFVPPGVGGLNSTEDIMFHPDGSVLVSGSGNTAVKRYDGITGQYLGNFTSGYALSAPSKMGIGPDSLLYVTQWGGSQKIVRFDLLTGNFIDEFTAVAVPNALGHFWDKDTNLYVVAYGSGADGKVQKFDPNGNDLGTFINTTYLQGPTSMWRDSTGDFFVEDWSDGNVKRYDSLGVYEATVMTEVSKPEGIDSLPNGDLLIGDWEQDCVHRFASDGTYLGYFTSGNGLLDANAVKVRYSPTAQLSENERKNLFQVYPTIGQGPFYLQYPHELNEAVQLNVTDMNGNLVADKNYAFEQQNGQLVWMPHNLKPGYYILSLNNNSVKICLLH